MNPGEHARAAGRKIKAFGLFMALALAPAALVAQASAATPVAAPEAAVAANPVAVAASPVAAAPVAAPAAATPAAAKAAAPKGSYVPMKPTEGKGMPVPGGTGFQTQYSPNGEYARWMHDTVLLWTIGIISVFVTLLLLFVIVRFNKRMNPVPSKTSHNTLIEILWTGIPILILLAIFVPSFKLLGRQYETPPAKALTIKVTGNQWFWTYTYPDNGGVEVISNMLPDDEAKARGEPPQLGVDYRMVVPVGEKIRVQVTGADVIHSFAVPSLWFKIDAVPGRINERVMFVSEPGVYYGQCSELCGARHGYMPIAIEALPREQYNQWVLSQGGEIDGQPKPAETPAAAAPAATAAATPAAAPASASPAPGA